MAAFNTSKGTTIHYSLEGHDIAATSVTAKFLHVESFTGLDVTREVIKALDLELDTEDTGAGKISVSDIEIVVRLDQDDATTYALFYAEMISDTNASTLKLHLPHGAGIDCLCNTTLTKVGAPVESGKFLTMPLVFSVSGLPKKI
jgi:hypothetical protein